VGDYFYFYPELVRVAMNNRTNGLTWYKDMQKLHWLGLAFGAIAMTGFSAAGASAEVPADTISKALFEQSGDIYRNRGIDRQATLLFGLSYPEHEFMNDAQRVENLYREGMRQQGQNDGVVRTVDLANPFNTSLRTNPASAQPSFGAGEAKAMEPENEPAATYPLTNQNAPRARG
jgi:hypothetical protein